MRALVPVLLLPALAWAQAVCPSIDFVNARREIFYDSTGSTGLARGASGSLELYRFQSNLLSRVLDRIPRYERVLTNCIPVQVGDLPESALVSGRPFGVASTTAIVIKNVGDGTAVGVWTSFSRTQIAVYRTNADYFFRQRDTYSINGPRSLQTADFDRDGKPDIAVLMDNGGAQGSAASIAILRGNGDGTFQSPVLFPAGPNSAGSFAMGDFNKDGSIDFAVASSGVSTAVVSIVPGNGDGTFRAPTQFTPGGLFPRSIGALDFNGDANLDLVIANGQSNNLSIHLGNGNGTFQAAINVPASSNPAYVAWGDLNKDGRTDLVVTSDFGQTASVLLATGSTTFQPLVSYVVGYNAEATLITDVNRDGNPDIVIADGIPEAMGPNVEAGDFVVLFGNGSGGFYAAPSLNAGDTLESMTAGDLNGDGRQDLIVSRAGGISVVLGRAPGTPLSATRIAVPNPGGSNVNIRGLAAADFNRDGKLDILAAERSPASLVMLEGVGDGTFRPPVRYPGGNALGAIAAADFNGDGRPDVAVANLPTFSIDGNPGLTIVLANSSGGFQAPVTRTIGTSPRGVIATDLNGDSRVDLLVLDYGTFDSTTDLGGVNILLGNGKGTFQDPVKLVVGRNPSHFALGDFNGDRRSDLAVSTRGAGFSDNVGVVLGNGNGTFGSPLLMPSDFGPGAIAAADFNGDGKQDLIVAHCCGDTDMTSQLGNGDGTFGPEVHFAGGADPNGLAVADFNADSKPDLAVMSAANIATGGIAILLNASPGTAPLVAVSAASFTAGPVAPEAIVAAFGSGLATGTAATESTDLPTTLAGTFATVTDSAGQVRTASLFAVSPGQVNFLVPPGTESGLATLTITSGDGSTTSAKVLVSAVAPGVFFVNNARLAAAYVLRVKPSGEQIVEPVAEVDGSGQVVPKAIDFGDAADRLFLQLFATGLRNRSSQSGVSATIGGGGAGVQFAGPQGGFPGLDQVNLTLLRNFLVGKGDVDVVLTVDGKVANITRLRFK